MKRIYYDTEFLDDGERVYLISIGMVTEDGEESYYAVNADMPFVKIKRHSWLMGNIVPHLPGTNLRAPDGATWEERHKVPDGVEWPWELDFTSVVVKPQWVIANEVREFVLQFGATRDNPAELWSYYTAHDHVVLTQLFGPMTNAPGGFPMKTDCLQQAIEMLGIPDSELPPEPKAAHDALADAHWHRDMGLRVQAHLRRLEHHRLAAQNLARQEGTSS